MPTENPDHIHEPDVRNIALNIHRRIQEIERELARLRTDNTIEQIIR